jgi:hypothetical protein
LSCTRDGKIYNFKGKTIRLKRMMLLIKSR